MIHLICPNPALDRTLLVEKIEKNIPLRPTEVRDYPGGFFESISRCIWPLRRSENQKSGGPQCGTPACKNTDH